MSGPDDETIIGWFKFHPATAVTGPMHDDVRVHFRDLAKRLLNTLPAGPDRTLALRKLQEAMMLSNACIANNQDDALPALNPHSGTHSGATP